MSEETQVKQPEATQVQATQVPPAQDESAKIRESRDVEFQAKIKAQQEVEELKKRLSEYEKATQEKASSDKETLLKSWQEKCAKLEGEIKKRDQHVLRSRLDSVITELASKINSEVPELFKPMIEKRIRGELNEQGNLSIHCLDKNGNPTAQTPDEVIKEIVDNKKYHKYIIGNKASGSTDETNKTIPFPSRQAPTQGQPIGDMDLATVHPDILEQVVKQNYTRIGA